MKTKPLSQVGSVRVPPLKSEVQDVLILHRKKMHVASFIFHFLHSITFFCIRSSSLSDVEVAIVDIWLLWRGESGYLVGSCDQNHNTPDLMALRVHQRSLRLNAKYSRGFTIENKKLARFQRVNATDSYLLLINLLY